MQSGFWQHTELNLHRFSSLPWLRCRQEGSLGAEFVISGKQGFAVHPVGASGFFSSHPFSLAWDS